MSGGWCVGGVELAAETRRRARRARGEGGRGGGGDAEVGERGGTEGGQGEDASTEGRQDTARGSTSTRERNDGQVQSRRGDERKRRRNERRSARLSFLRPLLSLAPSSLFISLSPFPSSPCSHSHSPPLLFPQTYRFARTHGIRQRLTEEQEQLPVALRALGAEQLRVGVLFSFGRGVWRQGGVRRWR